MASPTWKTNSQKAKLISHLCALLVVTVWGASFVSTKVLTNAGLGAVEIYIYRFVLAYLLVLAACHKRIFADNLRDELLFAVCGLCGGSIYFIAENNAVNYTRVSDVSMITTLSPLLTTLLIGALYKNERPGRWTYISSLIAFAGVGCIVFKDGLTSEANSPDALSASVGQMLALGAAFSWAIYSVVLRKLNVTYSAQFITRKTFFYGLLTALPFWMVSSEPIAEPSVLLGRSAWQSAVSGCCLLDACLSAVVVGNACTWRDSHQQLPLRAAHSHNDYRRLPFRQRSHHAFRLLRRIPDYRRSMVRRLYEPPESYRAPMRGPGHN